MPEIVCAKCNHQFVLTDPSAGPTIQCPACESQLDSDDYYSNATKGTASPVSSDVKKIIRESTGFLAQLEDSLLKYMPIPVGCLIGGLLSVGLLEGTLQPLFAFAIGSLVGTLIVYLMLTAFFRMANPNRDRSRASDALRGQRDYKKIKEQVAKDYGKSNRPS